MGIARNTARGAVVDRPDAQFLIDGKRAWPRSVLNHTVRVRGHRDVVQIPILPGSGDEPGETESLAILRDVRWERMSEQR